MSKTYHRVVRTEAERDEEAPAHKSRRKLKKQLDHIVESYDPESEEYDEVEQYEPIRRKKSR